MTNFSSLGGATLFIVGFVVVVGWPVAWAAGRRARRRDQRSQR